MNIIGITGFRMTGKSACADYLLRTYGFRRVRFAGPLKDMLRALGLNDEQLEGSLKEEPCDKLNGVTPRLAMQTLGTEWGRLMIHPNLWIDAWKRQVAASDVPVVCDDCRFSNEFDAIREMGGKVIRVTRPGREGGKHASESEMADLEADYSFVNNGTLPELYRNLENALRQTLKVRIERV